MTKETCNCKDFKDRIEAQGVHRVFDGAWMIAGRPAKYCPWCGRLVPPVPGVCRIFGSEVSFHIDVDAKRLPAVAREIWQNPSVYWPVKDGTDQSYYAFLKFLWIRLQDGSEVRLGDYVTGVAGQYSEDRSKLGKAPTNSISARSAGITCSLKEGTVLPQSVSIKNSVLHWLKSP